MSESHDRRRRVRLAPERIGGLGGLRFRTGGSARIIDVSPDGALVETGRYLGPGAAADVVLSLDEASVAVRVRVAHARVWRLAAGRPPCYRVGLAFVSPPERLSAWRVSATRPDGSQGQEEPSYPVGRPSACPDVASCAVRRVKPLAHLLEQGLS